MKTVLSFDDVLLEVKISDVESRSYVDLTTTLGRDKKTLSLKAPIVNSPMEFSNNAKFIRAMRDFGALGLTSRINPKNISILDDTYSPGISVGIHDDLQWINYTMRLGASFICVDTANGHNQNVYRFVSKLRKEFPATHIMAGNVASVEGAVLMRDAGADSIRVGIGGGSACTTRIMTGHGIPTWQSVYDIAAEGIFECPSIIADGGIRNSGDAVKALAAGADAVMLGNVLSKATEARGAYRGMASAEAKASRGEQGHVEGVTIGEPERVTPLFHLLRSFCDGIRSGCAYSGALSLTELRERATFVQQTPAAQRESQPHGLLA